MIKKFRFFFMFLMTLFTMPFVAFADCSEAGGTDCPPRAASSDEIQEVPAFGATADRIKNQRNNLIQAPGIDTNVTIKIREQPLSKEEQKRVQQAKKKQDKKAEKERKKNENAKPSDDEKKRRCEEDRGGTWNNGKCDVQTQSQIASLNTSKAPLGQETLASKIADDSGFIEDTNRFIETYKAKVKELCKK